MGKQMLSDARHLGRCAHRFHTAVLHLHRVDAYYLQDFMQAGYLHLAVFGRAIHITATMVMVHTYSAGISVDVSCGGRSTQRPQAEACYIVIPLISFVTVHLNGNSCIAFSASKFICTYGLALPFPPCRVTLRAREHKCACFVANWQPITHWSKRRRNATADF